MGAAVITVGLGACGPQSPEEDPVEHLVLSPGTDPATSQTLTWWAEHAELDLFLEVAPQKDPERITRFEAHATGDEDGRTGYVATATGLEPNTAYHYRIGDQSGDGGAVSGHHTFTTAAEGAEPFVFLHFGDVQNDIADRAAPVIRAGLETEPAAALALHSGDLVDSADSDTDWDEWFEAFGPATANMNHLAAPGNHEYTDEGLSGRWTRQFPGSADGPDRSGGLSRTVHHTDYQGVRFVVLNSNYRDATPHSAEEWLRAQRQWLERVLSDNPHRWTVVTFHHPVFSNHPDHDNALLRREWLPVLEEFDVDLVLQGHDHSYGRGNLVEHRTEDPDRHTGPVYVVAVTGPKAYEAREEGWTEHGAEVRAQDEGTSTFQVVEVDGGRLEYSARTQDGRTVDSFTIVKDDDGKRVTDTF